MKKNQNKRLLIIILIVICFAFFIKPIQQNQEYHNFADNLTLNNIPNFWNVISNFPFIIIGVIGMMRIIISTKKFTLKHNFIWFFIGIVLTGFGSGYYHLNPNDSTLIWDRLPMTIAFMSFTSIIIGEFINLDFGRKTLYPLLTLGGLSILYWIVFKDLRMYVLVQFLPLLLIPIILFQSNLLIEYKKYFWCILLAYASAKLLETYDLYIYSFTFNSISGHSLKHFAAAFGPIVFYKFINIKYLKNNKNAK